MEHVRNRLPAAERRDGAAAGAAHSRLPPSCAACKVRDIAVCSVLDSEELHRLSAIMTPVALKPQQTIFLEGAPADTLYNITGGSVRIQKLLPDGRRQITGFLYPGDFLGLAANEHYAYSAECIEAVTLCCFPRWKLDAFVKTVPQFEKRLFGMASNELLEAQEQMLVLGRKTAQERIASFLLMISRRAARRGQSADSIYLPMSRAEIADFLGLAPETVSRIITQLKTSGAIRLIRGSRVRLVNIDALAKLAGNGE